MKLNSVKFRGLSVPVPGQDMERNGFHSKDGYDLHLLGDTVIIAHERSDEAVCVTASCICRVAKSELLDVLTAPRKVK